MARIADTTFTQWRQQLAGHLQEAREAGTLTTATTDKILVDQILSMLMGLQILAVLTPTHHDGPSQVAQIEAFLASLMPTPR